MKETEYKIATVQKKTEYVTTYKCDRCGKVLFKHCGEDFRVHFQGIRTFSVSYYRVTTGHNDWGNDSVDSIEHKIYCPSCLVHAYSDFVDRASDGWNTEYINIEHEDTYSLPIEEGGTDD